MRFPLHTLLTLAALSAPILAADVIATSSKGIAAAAVQTAAATKLPSRSDGTIFNGKEVPPLNDLAGASLDDDISKGYWIIDFFSPYCPHCKELAPVWQTLYEFYYTSEPLASSSQSDPEGTLNSFTRYYNFKFGKVDCVANGDACMAHKVNLFPTVIMFKDGKEVKREVGTKKLEEYSKWIEETLESIRPGSRSADGAKLPEVGAHSVEGYKTPERTASSASTTASTESASVAPSTKTEAPNPDGTSTPLTSESFLKLVTTTRDPWFVKFYAPWCHHCQALGPGWSQMAREMKGKLNVGEVNCDVEKRLCKDARIKGYPTMLFFRGGERVEYDGLRGVGDLIKYASSAVSVGTGVPDVDAEAFEKLEETEAAIFLYVYDHATTSEDFKALERLTLSLVGHARLVKTNDAKLVERFKISTWPRLLVSRSGKPSYYTPLAPRDMRDARKVLTWMKSVWMPLVPELTATNAREIMDGKLVVLAILSRDRSIEFNLAQRELKNAAIEWMDKQTQAMKLERQELRDAKQLRIEEAEDRNDQAALRRAKSIRINMDEVDRRQVSFAWVDGVFWERWIRTTYGITVKDGERVIINDEANHVYWDATFTGNPIVPSRTSILETLSTIFRNPHKLNPKSTTSSIGHVFFRVRSLCSSHPWISLGVAVGVVVGASLWGKSRIRRGRAFGNTGGFFQLDGKEGLLGGASGNGKVD